MAKTKSPFLLLPAELRIKIYGYIWSDSKTMFNVTHSIDLAPDTGMNNHFGAINAVHREGKLVNEERFIERGPLVFAHRLATPRASTRTGILETCRQVYNEAAQLF